MNPKKLIKIHNKLSIAEKVVLEKETKKTLERDMRDMAKEEGAYGADEFFGNDNDASGGNDD